MKLEKMVAATADKARLHSYEQKNKGKVGKTVRVNKWQGNVVMSWDNMERNICEKTPYGTYKEELEVKLNLDNGESVKIPYVESNRHMEREDAVVESETVTDNYTYDGAQIKMLNVILEDGRRISIDERFVN